MAVSRREAHTLIHTLVAGVEEEVGTIAAGTDRTLRELIDEWFRLAGPPAESTRAVDDGYIRRQVLPHLGHVKVQDLRVVDLDRWYQVLIDDGLAPASIRKAHNMFVRRCVRASAGVGCP